MLCALPFLFGAHLCSYWYLHPQSPGQIKAWAEVLRQFTDGKSPLARGNPAAYPEHLAGKESIRGSVLYMGKRDWSEVWQQ